LSNVGLLYGTAPVVTATTVYSFSIEISDGTYTTSRSFTIRVEDLLIEFNWVSDSNLGSLLDGTFCNKKIQAVSIRPLAPVSYGLSGGMLPVGVFLDNQTGLLEGFVEYHGQDKTYLFEVTATDGVDVLIRLFEVQVTARNLGHFWSLSVPLLGTDKEQFIINNGEDIVPYGGLYLPEHTGWGRESQPHVTIINGVKGINAADLRTLIANYTHNFNIRLQGYQIIQGQDPRFQLVAIQCRDSDSLQVWQPSTSYRIGTRVSNADGYKYVALNSGISGSSIIRGVGSSITDGSIIWAWEGVPNSIGNAWMLPWYPYRTYNLGDIMENDGSRWQVVTSGRTSGGLGPQIQDMNNQNEVTDGEVTWHLWDYNTSPNRGTFWPSNVYNMRRVLEAVGWSNAWGTDANVTATVDFNGQVRSAEIVSVGEGYYNPPAYTLTGSGTGAELEFTVGIFGAVPSANSLGYVLGEQITVDLGNGTPAILQVSNVGPFGRVDQISIVNPGSFERIPVGPVVLSTGVKRLTVNFIAGLSTVSVITAGSGYTQNNTFVNVRGKELNGDMDYLSNMFDLCLPLAYATPQGVASFDVNKFNPYQGQIVEAHLLQATIQGIAWAGYSRFDNDQAVFDEDSTRFVDVDPSTETTFDQNNTIWENDTTTWDLAKIIWPRWSDTVFDGDHTMFDYYRTLFDGISPRTDSVYSKTFLWWFGKPFESSK